MYERYEFSSPFSEADVIDDPTAAMREILEADGHKVNGILADQEVIRAVLLGKPWPIPESHRSVIAKPLLFGQWMHEILPRESYWFIDNGS